MRRSPRLTNEPSIEPLRWAMFMLATVTGIIGLWLLTSELMHQRSDDVPRNFEEATRASEKRIAAAWAARIGLMRGDLWTEAALTYADRFWSAEDLKSTLNSFERYAARRAIMLAPHDARAWLLLASGEGRFDWLHGTSEAALRMSYYTGFNELELAPLRLLIAARSVTLDQELKDMVRRELRMLLTLRPHLRYAVRTAYNAAAPDGRGLFEATLQEIDPSLLATMRGTAAP